MAEMPMPMAIAPMLSRRRLTSGRLARASAKPDTAMAITSEVRVIGMLYASGMGSEKASMPMKCMDQMPEPIATAPPTAQMRAAGPFERATRDARLNAVYDTNTATATDSSTSQ